MIPYEGGSESSVTGVITLLIGIIGCCIIPCLKGLDFSFIMMPKQCTKRNKYFEIDALKDTRGKPLARFLKFVNII